MRRICLGLTVGATMIGALWLAASGCAEDEGTYVCTQALCQTGSPVCCPGGAPGTWNVGTRRCTCGSAADADADADADIGTDDTTMPDDTTTTEDTGGGAAPGSACNCDTDCGGGSSSNPPICVGGVCMTLSSADCSADPGTSTGCLAGSRCWMNGSGEYAVCWPDCASFSCVGDCDGDGSCVPNASTSCDPACGTLCASG